MTSQGKDNGAYYPNSRPGVIDRVQFNQGARTIAVTYLADTNFSVAADQVNQSLTGNKAIDEISGGANGQPGITLHVLNDADFKATATRVVNDLRHNGSLSEDKKNKAIKDIGSLKDATKSRKSFFGGLKEAFRPDDGGLGKTPEDTGVRIIRQDRPR